MTLNKEIPDLKLSEVKEMCRKTSCKECPFKMWLGSCLFLQGKVPYAWGIKEQIMGEEVEKQITKKEKYILQHLVMSEIRKIEKQNNEFETITDDETTADDYITGAELYELKELYKKIGAL